MEVYRDLGRVPAVGRGRAVALGTFDGVHIGHRAVIGAAVERARRDGLRPAVVTFDPHPAKVLRPDSQPKLLSTLGAKVDRIASLGVEELIAIPFTRKFSEMSANDFCSQVLETALDARFVSVGQNFRFGHGAQGDADTLRAHRGFETEVVSLVEAEGGPVSSTRIRGLIEQGDVEAAARLLGDPFLFDGRVVEGDRRGRELGMPTANIVPDGAYAVPGHGVYAATVRVGGKDVAAAVNVGVRPTFYSDGSLLVEAHLLDFDGNLYGRDLRLAFLQRLRDEAKFDSTDALVAQMSSDVERTREIASAHAQQVGTP